MKNWTLAPALVQLRKQLDAINPGRDKVSDGSIGDASHSARTSDHNPDDDGVVCAIDVTNNTVRGIAGQKLVDTLTANPDPRVRYLIFNGKITIQGTNLQQWKAYHGTNAHRHHVHISLFHDPKLKNSVKKWNLAGLEPVQHHDTASVLPEPVHLSSPNDEPRPVQTEAGGMNVQQAATVVQQQAEPPKPLPQAEPVEIQKTRPSLFVMIGTGITWLLGIGFNVGNFIQTKLEAMTNRQIFLMACFLGLSGLAMYFYHRSAERANRLNTEQINTAADTSLNTVQLKG